MNAFCPNDSPHNSCSQQATVIEKFTGLFRRLKSAKPKNYAILVYTFSASFGGISRLGSAFFTWR